MATNRKIGIVIASITCAVAFTRASAGVTDGDDNGISGIPHNGLSSEAFRVNALTVNQQALRILTRNGLRDAVMDPYIVRQLLDPQARAVLEEIVRCALPASEQIDYTIDDPDATQTSFSVHGELGLCKASDPSDPPDLASPECQAFVTACVAARVNALHKSIPISLRSVLPPLGLPASAPASAPPPWASRPVSTIQEFRERTPGSDPAQGILIGSFQAPCRSLQQCGWRAAYVGTCDPGDGTAANPPEIVSLAIRDINACASATLRVCAGLHGCRGENSVYPLPADFPTSGPGRYASVELRKEQHGACAHSNPLKFTCPTSEGVAGYFSTMVLLDSPVRSSEPYQAVVQLSGSGAFPALEIDAFSFPEGAFYGNLFRPCQLKRSCEVATDTDGTVLGVGCGPAQCRASFSPSPDRVDTASGPLDAATGQVDSASCSRPIRGNTRGDTCLANDPSLPYKDIYACYSHAQQHEAIHDDEASAATLNARLCDLPGGARCFPHELMRCHKQIGGGACTAMAGANGAFGECYGQDSDSNSVYHQIVTTYLNKPCDVIGEGKECDGLRETLPRTTPPPPKARIAPRAPDCGDCAIGDPDGVGCAIGGPGGAIWPVLVALGVRGWRRRRRPHAPAASPP